MKRYWYILLTGLCLFFALPIGAQETDEPVSDLLTAVSDTIVADSASLYPEWHVAPEIPVPLRAPRRATAAANCPLDSVLTCNIDSVLVEVTLYNYDAAGHTINQEVWTVKEDKTRIGKEKKEYGYTGSRQTMTAVYEWDATANAWKGTEKTDFTYSGNKMTSSTTYIWLNKAWVADKRFTYKYDAAGREIEYYEYRRNTSNNQLEYTYGFVYVWIDDTQKSLEELYTEAVNNVWTAGTKKEWAFDAEGNQTLYAFYDKISNGNWIGNSKETWAYTGPAGQLTMHETYEWYNNDWSMTLREIAKFDEAGKQTLIENYKGANGVTTGVIKEEYTFDGDIKTITVKYAWSNGGWVGSAKETWAYDGPTGQLTLHEKFAWVSGDWSKTLKEETEYSGANIVRIENYTYANGVPTGTKKETWTYGGPSGQLTLHEKFAWANNDWSKTLKEETEYSGANIIRIENYTFANDVPTGTEKVLTTYSGSKKTQILTFVWGNGAWGNSNLETWEYNGPSGKQTKHEKSQWGAGDWTVMLQENTIYVGNTTTTENYERLAGVWTGTKKEEKTVTNGKPTLTIIYAWENGDWVNSNKEEWTYDTKKQLTLHKKSEWENEAWLLMVEENTIYDGTTMVGIEYYERLAGVWTGTKKEEYTYEGGKKTKVLTYQWYNNDWMYQFREEWTFAAGHQTKYEKFGYNGSAWIDMVREIAAFDAAGNQILVETYALLTTTGWTGTKKEEYTFDGSTKISTVIYAWVDNDWIASTKNEIGYQDGNTEVSEANYTWSGEAWVGSGNRTYTTKDSEDRVIELLTKNWPSGATEWTNASITTHKFNAAGDDILTYNANWQTDKWVMSSMTRLDKIIDEKNRQLLKASWKCAADSNWVGIEKDTAKYSDTDKLLFRAKYKGWKNNEWIPVSKTENTYDAADRIILEESFNYIANSWRGIYRYETVYDEQGRVTSSASYNSWDISTNWWEGSSKQDNEYYKNYKDKYVSTTSYSWRNDQWRPTFSYLYAYDSSDREIEQIVRSYSSNTWKNKNKYVKKYDGSTLVGEYEYAWSNNDWALRSQHEWYYETDAQAKLRREIIGKWTSSGLTSYEDMHYSYGCDARIIRFVNYDGTVLQSDTLDNGAIPVYKGETPVREADAQYTYTYTGWDKPIVAVTSDATYTAIYSSTVNTYTVTWLNDEGTEIDRATLEYGATPSHADPTKAATAEYTYTFSGWTPEIADVTGDATYTATFSATKNQYTITWLHDDGSQIDQTEVEYGVVPTHADPTKAATDQYSYVFSGWTPDTVVVTGNATYTATFTQTTKTYTITWLHDDGSQIDQTVVEYGVVPTHADATKDNTAEWTYTFAGWNPDTVAVTGDASYQATFSQTKNSYTVTWLDDEGTEIDHATLEYGATPSHADPTKTATAEYTYTFSGWTPEIADVTGDATYTATFSATKNQYTITWLHDDGSQIDQTEVEYGVVPTHANPTKAATDQYSYVFSGWTPDTVAVTGNATYTATYSSTVNKYTVTFYDEDGTTVLDSREWEYGSTPTCDDPSKEATAQYTYAFAGWTPDTVAVTGETSYTATYSSTINKYTVTFYDEDGVSVLDSREWEYGATPICDDPTKPATDEYTYTFSGWNPVIEKVTGETSYAATYSSSINQYTITWLHDDGSQIDQTEVEYGVVPTHADATKDNTAEWNYTFAGWNPDTVAVTGEATYTAQFDSTKNSYTVIWLNEDGSEIDHETLEYGLTPAHAYIYKESTAEWTYTFAGWTPAITAVTADISYTATFTATKNKYTITWLNWDNSLIDTTMVEYGEIPTHADAVKENTAEYTYSFTGWTPIVEAVTGDETYTATFLQTKNKYTVTFYDEDGTTVLDSREWEYGETPTCTEPTKAADEQHTYYFAGWNPELVSVTGEARYTATFAADETDFGPNIIPEDGNGDSIIWPVDHGTTIYLHALTDSCHTFHWSDIADSEDPTYAINPRPFVYEGVRPEFDVVPDIILYKIAVAVDDSTHGEAIFVLSDSSEPVTESEVACGSWIELRTSAFEGWHFDHWNDGDTSSVRQVEVDSATQYIAYFVPNCGDYPTLPVVTLYDWLIMLDVRTINEMGYTFAEEDVTWYRVHGTPDRLDDETNADDERVGTGYSFTINESLVNTGDYYAMVDVSKSQTGMPCTGLMRSQIVHYASSSAATAPMLAPTLVRPNEPQQVLGLNPDESTTITIYDISGHTVRTLSEDGVEQMSLQAESVAGCYQVVVQNGHQRTVLRCIVVK